MEQSYSQATLTTVLKKVLARIPRNLTEKREASMLYLTRSVLATKEPEEPCNLG
jgi:hypothetical protein